MWCNLICFARWLYVTEFKNYSNVLFLFADLPFEAEHLQDLFAKIENGKYTCPGHFTPEVKCTLLLLQGCLLFSSNFQNVGCKSKGKSNSFRSYEPPLVQGVRYVTLTFF